MEVNTINTRVIISRCALAAALVIIANAGFGANLLKNPGFENGLNYWATWKSDWGSYLSRQAVTAQKVSGNYSLVLSTNNCSFGVYQPVTVTPGKAYQMNGWWKGTSAGITGSVLWWFDCELLDGPFNLTIADSRPQDLPYKVATYDPPSSQKLTWGWEKLSDAYYTTLALTPEIPAQNICRNGIRVATTTQMLVLLKAGSNSGGTPSTCYYDDISLEEVPVMSAADARKQADSTAVMLDGVTVTAIFPDCIYVESPNHVGGIKVVIGYPYTAYIGATAKIAGILKTDSVGDRYIEASYISCTGTTAPINPVAMVCKSLSTVTNGSRPNTLGMLVRISGAAHYIDATHFSINDGSGVEVKCEVQRSITVNPSWTFASVTGVSSCYKEGDTYKKLLRVRQLSDIAAVTQ